MFGGSRPFWSRTTLPKGIWIIPCNCATRIYCNGGVQDCLRANRTRKLYIPRVNYRVVLNETDLINLLDGFEIFDPGRYSFAKQIEMFSEAKKVVGAHGAGLTNLLFAPEGCRVLELFPHRGGTGAYISLATALNHDYDLVMAEGLPPRPGERESNELSFTVPLEQVAQWLQGNA